VAFPRHKKDFYAKFVSYTASPEEAEFVGLTAVVGTIQLYR